MELEKWLYDIGYNIPSHLHYVDGKFYETTMPESLNDDNLGYSWIDIPEHPMHAIDFLRNNYGVDVSVDRQMLRIYSFSVDGERIKANIYGRYQAAKEALNYIMNNKELELKREIT